MWLGLATKHDVQLILHREPQDTTNAVINRQLSQGNGGKGSVGLLIP